MNWTFGLRYALLFCFFMSSLSAENYTVGSGEVFTRLQDVVDQLEPGDTVQVKGNANYPGDVYVDVSGTENSSILIMGIQGPGESLPVISGGNNYGINISGDYVVLQGFEVDAHRKGIGVFGDHITVRGCVIHDCNHGLIGYGSGTGNVTVEYCEFYGNGVSTGGATQHQIYMATDEHAHPGATFRLQFCYLHNSVEGDNVKSRAERNEIYYNWIELAGSSGHGLGLFAPDPEDNENVGITTAREDADVVGNVIIQDRYSCARIGGDIPGQPTNGRYRFVNNTFILTGSRGDVIRTFNTVETLEMYNNIVYNTQSGADVRVLNDSDGEWVHAPRTVTGSHNWVIAGATRLPTESEWSNTFRGESSPFVNADEYNYVPLPEGVLVNNGLFTLPGLSEYPFQSPLFPPVNHPPVKELLNMGTAFSRPDDGLIDIGAYEHASTTKVRRHSLALTRKNRNYQGETVYRVDGKKVKTSLTKDYGISLKIKK
ncbi:MAG: hypothetical protein HQK83_19385 [Fibrobacteria bacterium]|nr:hypothetical protein [Fibrobacteria bacterium]